MILDKALRRNFFGMIGFVAALASAGTAAAFDLPFFLKGGKEKTIIWLDPPAEEEVAPLPAVKAKAVKPKASEQADEKTGEKIGVKESGPAFITSVRPPRKPAAQPVETASLEQAKEDEASRIAAAVGEASPEPVAPPAISQKPEQIKKDSPSDAARLSPSIFEKQPSLLDRMFGKLGAARRLSDEDAARYAHIFAFQDVGQFLKANDEIAKLSDFRLLGHVLWQRYTSPGYKSTYAELADWMKRYADHPGAQKIHDLAKKKKPASGAVALASPRAGRGVYGMHDFDVGQLAQPYIRTEEHSPKQKGIIRSISRMVAGSPTAALGKLEKNRDALKATQYDSLLADIAASYFYNGKTEKAYELATTSAGRSGKDVPVAGWVGGLSAWQMGKYSEAARLFELTAQSRRTSAWMASAGAYWAARASLRAREPQNVNRWLRRAAEYPRTFYGLIAMKALGMHQEKFNWKIPGLSDRHVKALLEVPAGRRALALAKAERPDLAEQELGHINPGGNEVLQEAMIALASESGMPGLAMRMGSAFKGGNGKLYDAALYPDVPWQPPNGFSVDRALVYAFIRQESRFQTNAANRSSGAIGLMQLMPTTAKHVAKQHGDSIGRETLRDPTLNIDLGQKYLSELMGSDYVDNNLFKLAIAYNAGPGKLARWEQNASYASDPLLFIEAIPVAETRIFVERVMTNYWIYCIKHEQDTASLDHVAEGNWPLYTAQDVRPGSTLLAVAESIFGR
jgi:soluble lytic murein transglycosylase-like protein